MTATEARELHSRLEGAADALRDAGRALEVGAACAALLAIDDAVARAVAVAERIVLLDAQGAVGAPPC